MLQLFKNQGGDLDEPVILVVTRDASTVQAMEFQIAQDNQLGLKLVEHLRDDALKYLESGNNPDVIVVELDSIEESELHGLDVLMQSRPAETPVVVISPSIDEEMVRLFLRLRVADWLRKPSNPQELVQVCRRVVPSKDSASDQQTKCYSFIGAHGGAGVTTLAVNTAILLSENRKKGAATSTCLVDLDFASGMCSEYLDVQTGLDLKEILPDPDRLDVQLLGVMLSQYSQNLSMLAARTKFGEYDDVDPSIIARLLDLSAQRFSNIVIDMPRGWHSWTDTVLLGSNDCFIVAELTVPGLRSARRMINEFQERLGDDVNARVIINKHNRPLIKTGISHTEVEQVLGDRFAGYVGDEARLAREAIDRGVPIVELKRRNRLLKDLEKIILGR
ncbi:MAG: hypothetical protein OER56_06665 [Hyphomicrobiales bacterium]|nr:hypothetical protein [Hyphomicrobiales bacterium]